MLLHAVVRYVGRERRQSGSHVQEACQGMCYSSVYELVDVYTSWQDVDTGASLASPQCTWDLNAAAYARPTLS